MNQELPRLAIVSEATFSADGTGINRTLVNLFKNYPADKLLLISPSDYLATNPPIDRLKERALGVSYKKSLPRRSRFIPSTLQSWGARNDLHRLASKGISEFEQIRQFDPETILLCTNSLECMLIGSQLKNALKVPFYTYAMDDWKDLDSANWRSGNGKELIRSLLRDSSGWIMISESLESTFKLRYESDPKRTLIVHNPVELNEQAPLALMENKEYFQIAYAGAIWPMHLDALMVCAKAVKSLRQQGMNVGLVLYTPEHFWKSNKAEFEEYEVQYGGLIPYEDLNAELVKSDVLLVSSSFDERYKHLSFNSVQTKLTDYMAAARPILSIGPVNCSCNEFVKKWDCGIVYSSKDDLGLAEVIRQAASSKASIVEMGKNGYNAAAENFTTAIVSPRLYSFLKADKGSLTSQDLLTWEESRNSIQFDKNWPLAASYLSNYEFANGMSLQSLWRKLDRAWDETGDKFPDLPQEKLLREYYHHPVWLLLGAFSDSDPDTIADRLAAVRLISSVKPEKIIDFGGGLGTACRLAAKNLPTAKQIDLIDVGPFSNTTKLRLASYPNVRVLKSPDAPYDAAICTEVLEHLTDPIDAIIQLNNLVRIGGALALSYSFAPGIKCHLPHNFHLRTSMFWIVRALGFGFYGFERRGSPVYGFIKQRDVTRSMIRKARFLSLLSKLRLPMHRAFSALRGV